MADERDRDQAQDIDVEPLSDEALDSVAGGGASSNGCCSCAGCSNGEENL